MSEKAHFHVTYEKKTLITMILSTVVTLLMTLL